jgi:spore cortex formation protein SpoVR/YcgB (stage V sporulation)
MDCFVALQEADAGHVLQHLADLWGYDVSLTEIDATNTSLKEYLVKPRSIAAVA